jgi:hypothetical protein
MRTSDLGTGNQAHRLLSTLIYRRNNLKIVKVSYEVSFILVCLTFIINPFASSNIFLDCT